jgi:cupin 2 domain-containing protein
MRRPILSNILRPFDVHPDEEVCEQIATGPDFLFERIVSFGHVTPDGIWLDQPRDEWVVLLAGAARLRFEVTDQVVQVGPGDALLIPAHCRHRVDWTEPGRETIWLALHFRAAVPEPQFV